MISSFESPRISSGFAKFLILACLLMVTVVLSNHALKHGQDAMSVRVAICQRGPFAQWLEKDGCAVHNLVELEDGRVGDQVQIQGEDGLTYEMTSLVPKCGVLCQIEQWLMRKNAVKVWPK